MITNRTITFKNGVSLTLAGEGRQFLGIGAVQIHGMPLRSPALPWSVYTESDTGVQFDEFELLGITATAEGVVVEFQAIGRWHPRIQSADSMGDSRIKTRRVQPSTARFRWYFRPVSERIQEHQWHGVAMHLEMDCPGHPINWLLEAATWEIGGAAAGATLIQRDVSTIGLEQSVTADSAFSTIEKFFTTTAGGWGGSYPMDMLPRCAGASPLDFQVKDGTALCLFTERPSLSRARLEKSADENVIHYLDRAFFPLTSTARTPERKLLIYQRPQPLARHEWRNLWLDCFTEVRERILRNYGFTPEIPHPHVHVHLWDPDLKRLGARWHDDLIAALPTFARLGYKGFFTHGVWESVTSDPVEREGNICCPYAFRFAEAFGGNAGMKRLADAAHTLGLEVSQWFGFQFARYAPLWKEHPEWLLREQHGDPWDGQYEILWCGRMRSPFRDTLRQQIKAVKDATGIDSIFFDSYQNLGVTCVDWQVPDQAPQADEIWELQAELQRYGFKFRCEVVTIFGVSQVQLFGFETDRFRRRLWSETVRNDDAFVLLDCSPAFFCEGSPFTADRIDPATYFWLAAHRALPCLDADPWHGKPAPGGALAEGYARVNHFYNAVLPAMHRLRVTERGDYVVWLDKHNEPAVVWSFRPATMPYCGRVEDLCTGKSFVAGGTVDLTGQTVYRLQGAGKA